LSHGFAIAVVLLLAIGLIYRGELFPEYDLPAFLDIGKLSEQQKESTTGQVDRDVVETEAEAPAPATADEQGQTAMQDAATASTDVTDAGGSPVEGADVADEVVHPGPADTDVTIQEPADVDSLPSSPGSETEAPSLKSEEAAESTDQAPATDTVVPLPGETGQQPEGEPSAVDVPPEDESTAATAADASVPEVMPAGVPGDIEPAEPSPESEGAFQEDTGAVEPVSRPKEKPYQLLADAREAYWLREYDTAESKYLALTRLEPDNPDGYGELGNMYFSQGKWDQAATAYYAAGVRLVEQGLLEQAEELIAVIRGLNGANADDLEQKIADARSAANQ
ncbi:MAG: hypothetical protein PVG72_09540, partial [Gammaproteobacteria bacterium]